MKMTAESDYETFIDTYKTTTWNIRENIILKIQSCFLWESVA